MSLDVYINDQVLELKENVGIGLTFQVGSILNPGNRAGNLSNKFSVPKSLNNNKILGNLSNINSATDVPYQRNSAKIVQDGIEIFPDAFAIIDSTGKDYKITVYSGNVSFFDLIKGKNVNELDWLASCHDFLIPNIIASFTNTTDYIYPMIDFGNGIELLNNTTEQVVDGLVPCAYINQVLEKIAASVGYEMKGSFLDYDQYNRLILTPNEFGFTEEEVRLNSGFATDVTVIDDDDVILSVCNSAPGTFEKDIPVFFNAEDWNAFSLQKFTPDNSYLGTFQFNVKGNIVGDVPQLGGNEVENGVGGFTSWSNGQINDDYIVYTRFDSFPATVEELVLYHIPSKTETVIHSESTNVDWTVSLTETNEGYVAFSVVTTNLLQVKLYDIAADTTSTIYSEAVVGITTPMDYIKIYNGRVAWFSSGLSGSTEGIWMYDIGTATTKNVTLSTNVHPLIDHNGDYLVWYDTTTNDLSIFDYVAGTNSVIENVAGTPEIIDVIGDYTTYYIDSDNDLKSFKISTSSLVTIKTYVANSIDTTSRTDTKISWIDTLNQLYWYDLLTDTLTTTTATNGSPALTHISMNDVWIAYVSTSKELMKLELSTGTRSAINGNISLDKDNVIIGKSNVVYYTIDPNTLRCHSINSGTDLFIRTSLDVIEFYLKAQDNDRLLLGNTDVGFPFDTVVQYFNPLFNTLDVQYTINIKEDSVVVYSQTLTKTVNYDEDYNIILNTGVVPVISGSEYDVDFKITAVRDETINYYIDYQLDEANFSFQALRDIPYTSKIEFSRMFNIDQDKVFKDIMNQYSLTVQTNELTKQIFLNPLDDLNKNLGIAKDWSGKINLASTPIVKYKIGRYGQVNYFNYAEDEDVPENTGRGSFTINNTELPEAVDVIKLNSAASIDGLRLLNEKTPTIPLKTTLQGAFDQKKNRILLLDRITKTIDWSNVVNADVGQSTDLPLCYFNKEGKTDNLDFNSLINDHYDVLLGMLDQVKFISAGFILNENDIANLDFTVPIFLDIHTPEFNANGYFYINKISNFRKNKTTKVDLIRL